MNNRKTKQYTKEEFLNVRFPCSTYDNILKVAFNKKGKGFLISWVVEGLLKYHGKQISTKYLKQFIGSTEKIKELTQIKESLYLSVLRSALDSDQVTSIKNSLAYDGFVDKGKDKAFLTRFFNKAFNGKETVYLNENNIKYNDVKKEHYKIVKKWVEIGNDLRVLRKAQTKKVTFLISEYGLKTKKICNLHEKEVFTKQRKEVLVYARGFKGDVFIKDQYKVTTGERSFKTISEIIFNIVPKTQ